MGQRELHRPTSRRRAPRGRLRRCRRYLTEASKAKLHQKPIGSRAPQSWGTPHLSHRRTVAPRPCPPRLESSYPTLGLRIPVSGRVRGCAFADGDDLLQNRQAIATFCAVWVSDTGADGCLSASSRPCIPASFVRFSRRAFIATTAELPDIDRAATAGLSTNG
jgi:hypothetical protein